MSKVMTPHPGRESLLLYADGELWSTAREEVSAHLAECSECQAWLAEVETGAADYAQKWMPALKEVAPAPPSPWCDLRERMALAGRTPAPSARAFRLRPRWAAIAAGIIMALVALQWYSGEEVSAAELLQEATTIESARERPRSPIRVTTPSGSIVRPAVWRPGGGENLAYGMRSNVESLRARFESANYSWEAPLSARSFSAWRKSLPDGKDAVVKVREGDGTTAYQVSTRTGSGALAEARLSLRISDLHAVRGSLRFRDNEIVEMSEVAADSAPAPPEYPASPGDTRPGDAQPEQRRDTNRPEETITPGEELRVWAALRRIDADIGEPVDIETDHANSVIVVTALGVPDERRRVLEGALSEIPRVQLQFQDPQIVREPSHSIPGARTNSAPLIQPGLESQFGNRNLAEEFTNRILEASESSLLRAHAIRKLALRFSPETERRLSVQDHELLQSLLSQHFAALDASSTVVLQEARRIAGAANLAPSLRCTQTWQACTEDLVAVSARVDKLLTQMLAVPDATANERTLSQELAVALVDWEAGIGAVRTLLRSGR